MCGVSSTSDDCELCAFKKDGIYCRLLFRLYSVSLTVRVSPKNMTYLELCWVFSILNICDPSWFKDTYSFLMPLSYKIRELSVLETWLLLSM